jgi:hypothetical protein
MGFPKEGAYMLFKKKSKSEKVAQMQSKKNKRKGKRSRSMSKRGAGLHPPLDFAVSCALF